MIHTAVLPRLEITVGGLLLPPPALSAIQEISVREVLGLPAQCEIALAASVLTPDPADGWSIGATLAIAPAGGSDRLFTGEITAISHTFDSTGATTVRVRAYDTLHRLRKRQTLIAREELTVAEIARALANEIGLSTETEADGPRWPLLLHRWPSDFDLLAEVCWRAGLYPVVEGDTLRLITLEGRGEAVVLTRGANLFEAEIEQNADAVCESVDALGWSALTAADISGSTASSPLPVRLVPLDDTLPGLNVSLPGDPGSPAAMDSAVPTHARAPSPPTSQSVGGNDERRLLAQVFLNDEHATALARAELTRRQASATVLTGCAEGNAALHPGVPIQLEAVPAALAGNYVLTRATHTMDQHRGYLTTISSAPPQLPGSPTPGTQTAVGIVTSVDDPDSSGRVQLTLPAYGEAGTGWMGVLALGAGPGKGVVVLPDVGDRVLVLLAGGDPGQGIVLGGLYGSTGAPEAGGVVGGAVRRYTVLTAGGHKLRLDDDQHSIRIESENGSAVELGPALLRISATTDLTIEAPGRAIVVRAKSVDFQHAESEEPET